MAESNSRILVWDAPVRVFHWLLALSFVGAYVTAESQRWLLLHVTLGYTLGGLVVFRILWGLLGTRYARFGSFVRGPAAVLRYGTAMLGGKPEHHVGHNPLGALAIVLLLLISLAIVGTGWALYTDSAGHWMKELHEGASGVMLAVVCLHVAGALLTSLLHRENLTRAMVTGKKNGAPDDGITRAWRPLALVLLLAVLGFWWFQWQSAPTSAASAGSYSTEHSKHGSHQRDHAHDED
jgi:cytochrome b